MSCWAIIFIVIFLTRCRPILLLPGSPTNIQGRRSHHFFPILIIGLYLFITYLPLLDPKKERYQEFSHAYQAVCFVFVLYLTGVYIASSFYGLGAPINIADVSTLGIGILFLVIGNFMPKFKPNWFVGIRTPWTLSDDGIWQKTHRVGGWVFFAGGLALIASLLAPPSWRWVLLIVIIVVNLLGTVGYSYILWRRTQKKYSSR